MMLPGVIGLPVEDASNSIGEGVVEAPSSLGLASIAFVEPLAACKGASDNDDFLE